MISIFGDASGARFGSPLWIQGTANVEVKDGIWMKVFSKKSSNFRELKNLALRLSNSHQCGKIAWGAEVFIFTNNQVVEWAFYWGTSSSQGLFNTVL